MSRGAEVEFLDEDDEEYDEGDGGGEVFGEDAEDEDLGEAAACGCWVVQYSMGEMGWGLDVPET